MASFSSSSVPKYPKTSLAHVGQTLSGMRDLKITSSSEIDTFKSSDTLSYQHIKDLITVYQNDVIDKLICPCEQFFSLEYKHVMDTFSPQTIYKDPDGNILRLSILEQSKYKQAQISDQFVTQIFKIRSWSPRALQEIPHIRRSFGVFTSPDWQRVRNLIECYVRYNMLMIAMSMTAESRALLHYDPQFYKLSADEFLLFIQDVLSRIAQDIQACPYVFDRSIQTSQEMRAAHYQKVRNIVYECIGKALQVLVRKPVDHVLISPDRSSLALSIDSHRPALLPFDALSDTQSISGRSVSKLSQTKEILKEPMTSYDSLKRSKFKKEEVKEQDEDEDDQEDEEEEDEEEDEIDDNDTDEVESVPEKPQKAAESTYAKPGKPKGTSLSQIMSRSGRSRD